MTLNNFNYSYALANQLFDVDMDDDDFAEIGLIAYNLIGNKRTNIYRTVVNVNCKDGSVELPCNADIIESVTRMGEDYQETTNHLENLNYDSAYTENYIESRKTDRHPLYSQGGFVNYTQSGNTIYVDPSIKKVRILYRGIRLDDDGLPEVTDKEALAIAHYVAYILQYKKGITTQNSNVLKVAQMLKSDWEKKCDAARIDDRKWSQNDIDQILDVKTSWDRKIFGKSYKIHK